ncbi:LysR family transcriptional regulator [Mycolicibacterium fortuitum]|uniref:LysR family transcriptional regulator n=1 Tax=Mycolicibacterium fortuitum TaxID=1766 RepID=UPI00241E0DF3|nr:LysR family transcriptional regulator [Mycolicibacterium fortuitum]MDG5771142.1 LysR family transcriptional regulator [Mycolicibacterium fortuitum]MDG5783174.1 LysR family transcriptional regulator [Mycolicibacterium fortuitum]
MIDVRKLRMLSALDRLGTIAAVADELHLTAPGVSMQINAFERELGVPVTERQGRRVVLTPAGRVLAAHGRDIVDRLSLAQMDVEALKSGVAGHYRVGAFPSAARTIVADAWAALTVEHPGLTAELTTPEPEAALADLTSGVLDLALIHSYSNVPRELPDSITAERVTVEPVWAAMHVDDALATQTVDLADLSDRHWVTPPRGTTCYDMVERACGLAGFRPSVVAQSPDFAVLMALVNAGIGVALVPSLGIGEAPAGVALVATRPELSRFVFAARRTAMVHDAGLDTLVTAITSAATRRPPRRVAGR